MKNGILFLAVLICTQFYSFRSDAQTSAPTPTNKKCIRIEGKSLGCVPSAFDTCHSGQPFNCKIFGAEEECIYPKSVDLFYASIDGGPKAFQCAEWSDPKCNTGSDVQTCSTGTCVRYKDPICKKKCLLGYKDYEHLFVKRYGCKRFCGEICDNEPQCDTCNVNDPNCHPPQVCPLTYKGLPLPRPKITLDWKPNTSPTCTASELPNGGVDPLGVRHDWDNSQNNPQCPPNKVEPETQKDVEAQCPWIKYPGKPNKDPKLDGCNPANYGKGNLFPSDCSISAKNCGTYCDVVPLDCKP